MPTYEYQCNQCEQVFEHFQSIASDPLTDCLDEGCGAKGSMKRLISAGGGLIFKGSGFYQTDYKGNGKSEKSSESTPCGNGSCEAAGTSACAKAD